MSTPEPISEPPRWRRIAGTSLFVLGWLIAGAWLLRDYLQPRFILLDKQINVGAVPAGGTTEVRFRMQNRGLAPVRLKEVVGSCGCLTPEFPRSVPPLGTAEIRTRFTPLPDWNGPMDKVLTIRTSDPAAPEVQAHLLARVEGLFRKEPDPLAPVVYRYGETHDRTLRLIPRPGSGVRLTAATTEVPFLKAMLLPPLPEDPEGAYRVQIEVGPCKLAGDFQVPVRLATTDPAVPALNVMVAGMAQRGPVLSPLRIFEPTFRAGNPGDEMLQARVFTREGQFRVKEAKATIPGVEVRVRADQPGRDYTLTLVQKGVLASGPHAGQLAVTTDDRQHPTIAIPVHLTVQ